MTLCQKSHTYFTSLRVNRFVWSPSMQLSMPLLLERHPETSGQFGQRRVFFFCATARRPLCCINPLSFLHAAKCVCSRLPAPYPFSVSTGNPGFAASDPSTGLTAPHLNLSIGDKTQYYFYTYDHHAIVSSDAVEPLVFQCPICIQRVKKRDKI